MDLFQIAGLVILALFYGSYLAKLLLQKRRGIRTNQMARGEKPARTFRVESVLRLATLAAGLVEFGSILLIHSLPPLLLSAPVRFTGLGLAALGVVVFVAAMATMRDNWRAGIAADQKTEMVIKGIYRFSRNPAFVGFDLLYIGMALAFSNPAQIIFAIFAIVMLHLQILEEEKFLPTQFGEEYLAYKKRTGRYFIR